MNPDVLMGNALEGRSLPNERFQGFPEDLERKDWRKTRSYQHWKQRVLERDNHQCQCCGVVASLAVHHINSAKFFTELRYDVNNGIVLCSACHSAFHNDFIGNTAMKCTLQQLRDFFKLKVYFVGMACIYGEK